MNIARSFVELLEDLNVAVFGQDIFISNAPDSNHVTDPIYWVIARGGSPIQTNQTGEKVKSYQLDVYYRALSNQTVYDNLQELEDTINSLDCVELNGFDTIDVEASLLSVDEDLDNEDRKLGLLQVNIRTYKEMNYVS